MINPLINAGIYAFVFKIIFHASSRPIPYVVFLLTNLTFWNFFANGLLSATGSVTGNAALLAKIYFPRMVLPTAAIMARLIDFAFSVFVLSIVIALYGVPVQSTLVIVPVILLIQVAFTWGVGLILSAVNVLYRDVTQLIGLILMVWFYLTPVMYRVTAVPQPLRGLLLLNPVGATVDAERNVLYTGHLVHPHSLEVAGLVTIGTLVVGWWVFRRLEPLFAEVM